MTPFMLLRLWLRRATAANKAGAAIAAAIALVLVVWSAVPSPNPSGVALGAGAIDQGGATSGTGSTAPVGAPGPAAATTASAAAAAEAPAANPAAVPGAGLAVSSPTGRGATTSPVAATPGTTLGTRRPLPRPSTPGSLTPSGAASTCARGTAPIKVGVIIIAVGSGGTSLNSAFGIPNEQQQRADYEAIFDAINKAGGVACHPLVGDYQTYNELDPSTAQSTCLQLVQDKAFVVMNGYGDSRDSCLLQNHVPVFELSSISGSMTKQFYPYLFSSSTSVGLISNNFAHALAQMGYFGAAKGFKKIGIFYRDCIPGEYDELVAALNAVGVGNALISSFNFGCPTGFAPPNAIESAVLQFKRDGVTAVSAVEGSADLQNFTKIAQQQGFKPQYLMPDDGIVATSAGGTLAPDPKNFDGAVAITWSQRGAVESKLPETAATLRCDHIMTSHNLPTVYESGDAFAGAACSNSWFFVAAAANAPTLSAGALVAGLNKAGSADLSFPNGPNDLRAPGTTFGGQFWRPLLYHSDCACWTVTDATYHPAF